MWVLASLLFIGKNKPKKRVLLTYCVLLWEMNYLDLYFFGVLLLFSSLLALAFKKAGQSSIAGYLAAGAFFHSFVVPNQTFEFLSFLGVILLLFFVGLEFSVGKIHRLGRKIMILGVFDFIVNFGIGSLMGYLLSFGFFETVILGGIVYISSSAVISKILMDSKCMDRRETKTIMGVLIFEDIVMAVLLAFFTALKDNPMIDVSGMLLPLAKAVAFCGFFLLLEKPIKVFFDRLLDIDSDEHFFLMTLGVVFLASFAAYYVGLSEAIGAFFIGSALAESAHQARVKKLLKPLGYFASSMFFLGFGLNVDLLSIGFRTASIVFALILASLAGKMWTGLLTHKINKLSVEESIHVGWSLFPRGEFSIILASVFAADSQMVANFTEIIAVYVFTLMLVSTFLIKNYTKKCIIELPAQ